MDIDAYVNRYIRGVEWDGVETVYPTQFGGPPFSAISGLNYNPNPESNMCSTYHGIMDPMDPLNYNWGMKWHGAKLCTLYGLVDRLFLPLLGH